jgi:hypothetical protein
MAFEAGLVSSTLLALSLVEIHQPRVEVALSKYAECRQESRSAVEDHGFGMEEAEVGQGRLYVAQRAFSKCLWEI